MKDDVNDVNIMYFKTLIDQDWLYNDNSEVTG